ATHGITAAGGLLLAVLLLVGGGVGHGDDLARLHAAGDYHHGFALFHKLHRARLELAVLALYIDQELAVLLEHGLRRDVNHVGQLFHLNLDVGQQSRTQQHLNLRVLLGRQREPGILPVLLGKTTHVETAAHHGRHRIHHADAAGAAATHTAKAAAGLPVAAARLSRGAASLAKGYTRFAQDLSHLLLELFTFFGRRRLHLLAQIGHLLAVLVGQIGEAAAPAAARARGSAALRIGPRRTAALVVHARRRARPRASVAAAPFTAATAAPSAAAAGIVSRRLRRRRREGIDAGVDPLLAIGFRRGHNARDVGRLHTHAGQ